MQLPPLFPPQFFANDGAPAAGYLLHTYESGTTTPKATYTNQAGSAANTNPIVLDSAGRCNLWLDTGEYTFVLATPADVAVWTRDDIAGIPEAEDGEFLPLAGGEMTGDLLLAGNATTALEAVPKQQLDAAITALAESIDDDVSNAVPIGTIALWLTGVPPSGWLHLNAQAVSRTTYAALFALWGTTFGVGDGSTTFNVPEVRGEFPRFWDASRGIDAGRAIGTAQAEETKAHQHLNGVGSLAATPFVSGGVTTGIPGTATRNFDSDAGVPSHQGNTSSTGGTETRPRNFSFMAIVKAL
jgi:microcystin-dependent protein